MKSELSLIKNFRIIFSNSGMKFKDNIILLPTKASNLIEILGSQPRILDAGKETGNMFYFWDNLGIYAIKDVKSEAIVEISIAMNKDEDEDEFFPFNMFNGDIQIEEFVFNRNSSFMTLEKTGMFNSESILFLEKKLGKYLLDVEIGDEDELLNVGFSLSYSYSHKKTWDH
jgi:hypothetical protein